MSATLRSASFFDTQDVSLRLTWARNVIFASFQADPNWTNYNYYYLLAEISVDSVGTITNFPTYSTKLRVEPDTDGVIDFEFQQVFKDYELMQCPVPDFNSTQVKQVEAITFSVKIYEVVEGNMTQLDVDRMSGAVGDREWLIDSINAGLDRESFSYEMQERWITGILADNGRKFLTNTEDPKVTHKDANEFLYWFGVVPNRGDISVFAAIHYDDGTDENITLFDAAITSGYHIQCIPTRYSLIAQKSTQLGKKIIGWDVWTGYPSGRIGEFFRYELPDQECREGKYFIYKNSFGVYDTLVCQGDWKEWLESTSQTATRRDKTDYSVSDAQRIMLEIEGRRKGVANTAWLNRSQAHVKQEIVISENVLLQTKTGFIPVLLEEPKMEYDIKNQGLLGMSINYQHAHNVKLYTNDHRRPILGEVPVSPELPKFIIRNIGKNGYVRVEFEDTTIDVAPDSEEGIEINENVSVTVTWAIVNIDTGLLDVSKVNISYPNYSFPARMGIATFDNVVQNGSSVTGIADENGIIKAREFTLTMPNNDYVVEVEFASISVIDFDFANPICTDNIGDGNRVVTVKDTQDRYSGVETTTSSRALLQNNALVSVPTQPVYGDFAPIPYRVNITDLETRAVFAVFSIDNVVGTSTTLPNYGSPWGRQLTGANGAQASVSGNLITNGICLGSFWTIGSRNPHSVEDTVGLYCDNRGAPHSGLPSPSFTMSQNFGAKLGLTVQETIAPTLFANQTTHNYPNVTGYKGVGVKLGSTGSTLDGNSSYVAFHRNSRDTSAAVDRLILMGRLTLDEYGIMQNEIKNKYNL